MEHKILPSRKELVYPCDKCDHSSETSEELSNHVKSSHKENYSEEFACSDCNKVYCKPMLLTSHKIEAHNFNPLKKELSDEQNMVVLGQLFLFSDSIIFVRVKGKI